MNKTSTGAALWRRPVTAVVLTMIMALLGGLVPAQAAAAPATAPAVAATTVVSEDPPPLDDEDQFNRELVEDIAKHAPDIEVREAAQAALDSNDPARIIWFLDYGEAEAKAKAAERKRVTAAKNRELVQGWAQTGGPHVRAGAQTALDSGDDKVIADFVAYGKEIAEKQDQKDAEDSKAEQDRITGRVRDMVAQGGPQVQVEGEAILLTGDYARIREFYLTGYAEANQRDHDFQQVIEKALEDRNKAITELNALARRAEAAADARAEIMRANINAVKVMEDGLFAMQMAVKAAHKADKIFQEDKPGRVNGAKGRNQDIDALRAEATEYAARGGRVAGEARGINTQVHNAAARLVEAGLTNGLDWAKVTIGISHAVEATAFAAETSQHAIEATLADSRALDADRNAQEHANNAHKYRAEAERQAQRALDLAAAARVQRDIALAARDRAEQQKNLAAQKAAQAKQHAANARTARANAQSAAKNAIAKSKDATTAYNNAVQYKADMDATVQKAAQLGQELKDAETVYGQYAALYHEYEPKLLDALRKAEQLGGEAWDEYRRIEAEANKAKAAAAQSEAWASRARAAAATARAEAQKATNAANAAHQAAMRANQEAVTARRAADETHRLALEAANAAVASNNAAEMVQREAESAVREANQSVYQSMIADRAAAAAAASAELVIDPVRAAESILKPFAGINADARRALASAAEALLISEEQSRLARGKATEAAAAAVRAQKAADEAVADIKPAYEAAARAVAAANAAAQDALTANDAANTAAQHATAASGSAATAAQWANSARSDATLASQSANAASSAAAAAGQAAGAAERIRSAALEVTKGFDAFEQSVSDRLKQVIDIRKRYDEAVRLAAGEAERKRQELNKLTFDTLMTAIKCKSDTLDPKCQELLGKIKERIGADLEALGNYIEDWFWCSSGVDADACTRYHEKTKKALEFSWEAIKGFAAAAVSPFVTVWEVGGCVISGVDTGNWSKCKEILDGAIYAIENPYMWINLPEWQTNPGKAFGGLAFDITATVATIYAGGSGGAAWKTVRTLSKKIDGGSGPLSKQLADLERYAVKLHESVRDKLPNAVGELLNLKARFDNGDAKFDGAIAVVDERLYRMEPFTVRPEGSPNLVDGAIIRLEGGTLRIENGLARLDGAKLKVEPPKYCPVAAMAVASAGCGKNEGPKTNPDNSYEHDIDLGYQAGTSLGALKVRLSPEDNAWANRKMDEAKAREPAITAKVDEVAKKIPTAERVGQSYELKDKGQAPYPSYKRKLFDEMNPKADKPGDPTPPKRSPDQVADKMNDAVRYTINFPKGTYALGAQNALWEFAKHFEEVKVKNFWVKKEAGQGNYPGINVTYRTKDGQLFEVQFHTPESFHAKDRVEHWGYEQKRALEAVDFNQYPERERAAVRIRILEEIEEFERQSALIFGPVETPVGAINISPTKP
ncbi:ALF repeat-containing protein [Amycolatopsis sp. WAC 01375]|uniref:ALF repeat-containing protein n=1 Tax=Amycolatopsis sp. WAC 01375 TaxID=2203194 RepID=UPI0013158BCC|nr:ALF repeat-containing protein [Amycolatopsis sp. WAC 01375]